MTRIRCLSPSLTSFACSQLQTSSENVSSLWNPWVQLFVCENAAVIVALNQFFASSPPDVLEKLPPELTAEWTDFFVEGIYNLLFPLPVSITGVCGFYFEVNTYWEGRNKMYQIQIRFFLMFDSVDNPEHDLSWNSYVHAPLCPECESHCPPCLTADAFSEPDDPVFPLAVLQSVGVALTYVPVQQLKQNSLPPRFIADQKTNLPEPLQTLLNTFCPLLLFKARPLQITVYHLLEK